MAVVSLSTTMTLLSLTKRLSATAVTLVSHNRHRGITTTVRPQHQNLTTNAVTSGTSGDENSSSSVTTVEEAVSETIPVREMARLLDIRVGRIVKAWKHEEADSLYVEEVDIGEESEDGPSLRMICSGLVKYVPLHALQDKKVVVLANLKARNMRGVKSFGMLMAASDSSHENVELLEPPESSLPGDRIWFGDLDENENLPEAASPNQIQKKKIWEVVQPHLKTNASCVAVLGEDVMRTSAGVVRCKSLKDANVS